MNRMRRGGLVAAAWLALSTTAAWSQTTTPDPLAPGAAAAEGAKEEPAKPAEHKHAAPRHHEEGGSLAVTVHNERSVGLMELHVGAAGGSDLKKVVGPLAFGRQTVIHVKHVKDCLYDVRGKFADEADVEMLGVDLCKDKAINLTD